MNPYLISIITISKNDLNGLYKTLESVKEQDCEAIEHIVIDGDSNDGTKELLENYSHSKKYDYFSEPDNGISSAFNKGLDKINGDLVLFLNSGDVLSSNTIISQVIESYLKHKWKCAVGGRISSNYAEEEVLYYPPKLTSNFLKYFMFLPHQSFFCETSLHINHKFDESIITSMDYELFLRMLKDVEIFYLPFLVSKCQPGGISSQSRKRVIEQSEIRLKNANKIHDKIIIILVNILIRFKDFSKINSPFSSKNIKIE
jgi:putative colanic acid biosynthesis glycosyltransferase